VASSELDRYLRRRRPRVDPLAWERFRVCVRGVLLWKRLLASLIRSRNLSPAVLLLSLAIFDSFRGDGNLGGSSIVTRIRNAGDLDQILRVLRALPD
jgi:hypothetical protein